MRLISKAILAGIGTVALAGSAYAAERSLHTMKVDAPDGTVVQIRYSGDQRPDVSFVPVRPVAIAVPMASMAPIAIADPMFADFANMDRMFAAMDAQMASAMRMAPAMPAIPTGPDGKPDLAALKTMPAGTVSYSYYSSSTGPNGCTQTVQYSSNGKDAQPKIVKTSAGDCTPGAAKSPAANLPVKAEASAKAPPAPGRDTV